MIPRLAAEFAIVFIGVAMALAADEWRQGRKERNLEQSYLDRLQIDLRQGRDSWTAFSAQLDNVRNASVRLIRALETGDRSLASADFQELAATAGAVGHNRNTLMHSSTFDELLATGNLSVIEDNGLRQAIIEHFLLVRTEVEEVAELPLDYNTRYKSITGIPPGAYVSGAATLTPELKLTLEAELRGNRQAIAELRHFQAEAVAGLETLSVLESIDALSQQLADF